ncbi:MAG: septal ring lytic transglycosylase RlpA family protein [Gammaproteobacteria bacterium]
MLFAAVLAACSSSRLIPPSGPSPDGYPDRDAVPASAHAMPDAVPVAAPRSRYGNPKTYEVMGERYFVLNSADGYKEKGRASWYGTKFHGKRTSSGEAYDMYQMTAAHKTLPLPTYVRVTRKSSGRSVVVKVNDRGPFHTGRIIDLSYAAAARLDLLKEGSAEVEVEALDPGAPVSAPAAPFLELASTDDPIYAVAVREDASGLGIGAVEIRTFEQGDDVRYRVLAGPFRDGASLEAARRQLAAQSLEGKPVSE